MSARLNRSIDKAAVNKVLKEDSPDQRGLKADEMLAISEITGHPLPGITLVPELTWVSAGKLVDSSTQTPLQDVKLLAFPDLGPGDFFALRVEGDSMDRVSPSGSVIVVNREDKQLLPGKPYVFWSRGATYKLWRPNPARLEPYSTNPAHQAIFLMPDDEPHVVGRVRRTALDL